MLIIRFAFRPPLGNGLANVENLVFGQSVRISIIFLQSWRQNSGTHMERAEKPPFLLTLHSVYPLSYNCNQNYGSLFSPWWIIQPKDVMRTPELLASWKYGCCEAYRSPTWGSWLKQGCLEWVKSCATCELSASEMHIALSAHGEMANTWCGSEKKDAPWSFLQYRGNPAHG